MEEVKWRQVGFCAVTTFRLDLGVVSIEISKVDGHKPQGVWEITINNRAHGVRFVDLAEAKEAAEFLTREKLEKAIDLLDGKKENYGEHCERSTGDIR
jgi:hypothetical protein